MNIIPQMKLFEESVLKNLGDLERLEMALDTLDDARLIRRLYRSRGKGRNDWPCEAMWNSFLASFLFEHEMAESLDWIAPTPLLQISVKTYGLYWIVYIALCTTIDFFIAKRKRTEA